jgi:hypothetical protein
MTDPTTDPKLYKVRRNMSGQTLMMHLYIMHGHHNRSVHDTEALNQQCHEEDHKDPFGAGYVPHAHVLSWDVLPEDEEWTW